MTNSVVVGWAKATFSHPEALFEGTFFLAYAESFLFFLGRRGSGREEGRLSDRAGTVPRPKGEGERRNEASKISSLGKSPRALE